MRPDKTVFLAQGPYSLPLPQATCIGERGKHHPKLIITAITQQDTTADHQSQRSGYVGDFSERLQSAYCIYLSVLIHWRLAVLRARFLEMLRTHRKDVLHGFYESTYEKNINLPYLGCANVIDRLRRRWW